MQREQQLPLENPQEISMGASAWVRLLRTSVQREETRCPRAKTTLKRQKEERELVEAWQSSGKMVISQGSNIERISRTKKAPDATELRDHEKKNIRGSSTFTCRGHCQNVRPCLW